jgi:ABC-type Fe3+-hydroxamate transport system substrate-binding protein
VGRVTDDVGREVALSGVPARLVSLVPSITECLFAVGAGASVVGATRFCVEPPAARLVARIGGTKNPDLGRIRALAPDLVFANAEENRSEDVDALVAAGIAVYVTFPRTVETGIAMVRTIGSLVGMARPGDEIADRLAQAFEVTALHARAGPRPRVFCPIWKRPWMTFNRDTFAHAMVVAAGGENVGADLSERYPVVDAGTVARLRPDVVLLPSEPYRFQERDRADVEAFLAGTAGVRVPIRFVDGRALTWYGPRIDWGLRHLRERLIGDLVAAPAP